MSALNKAISIAGSAKKLADEIGVSKMAISIWRNRCRGEVPPKRVLDVYRVTGVTPHELRPDLYPNPSDGMPPVKQDT